MFSLKRSGKVYLVGAGPGDRALATLKAIDCIKEADVIVYDRLVNKDLLEYRKSSCEMIYVGKKSNKHTFTQDKINEIISDKAKEGLIVVRLKGGDPYVFGRGGEEAEILFEENIDFEVVPGISSSIGGLSYAGIPVTHRDFASSFHVVTGHAKKDSDLDINWKALSEEKGTIIFLMGIGNISFIRNMLIENGRKRDTPVAFVSWATRHNQKTVLSTLENAEEVVKSGEIEAPAIFVVGEVVKLSNKLNFFERKAMFGKTVIVTRSRKKNSELKEKIEELAGRTIELSTIDINRKEGIEEKISNLDFENYNCIAFTSHNAVEIFFEVLKERKIDIRILSNMKLASIGKATSDAIESYGIYPDIEADDFTGEGLANKIIEKLGKDGNKILFPCSEIAGNRFEDLLSISSNEVDRLEIYTNRENLAIKDELIDILKTEKIDYITFTSSSTFKNLKKILGDENMHLLDKIKKVSIGEITSNTIRKSGFKVDIQAEIPAIESLIEAIKNDINKGK